MTSPSTTAKVTLPADEQILVTREFDAAPPLVYKAWTTARARQALVERAARRDDARRDRPARRRHVALRDGRRWRSRGGLPREYREIVPNERTVATEVYEGPWPQDGEPAVTTVTFTALDGGRTLLEQLMQVASRQERDAIIATGMETGIHEQLDLIDELTRSLD